MKKKIFNLSVILAVLVAAFSFTSCGDDEGEAPEVKVVVAGEYLSGTIYAENGLKEVQLLKDGTTKQKWESFSSGDILSKGDDSYVVMINIASLSEGEYVLRAIDKENKQSEGKFTIAGVAYSAKVTVSAGETYAYRNTSLNKSGEFTVVSAAAGEVKLKFGNTEVTLSDGAASYLSKDLEEWDFAVAKEHIGDILMCLLGGSKDVASATLAASDVIKGAASATEFAKK